MKVPRKYRCPNCGEKSGVDIIFGMPGVELMEAEARGEIILGGCCIDMDGPERQCLRCGSSWRITRRWSPLPEDFDKE